jgi:hypothetical protein
MLNYVLQCALGFYVKVCITLCALGFSVKLCITLCALEFYVKLCITLRVNPKAQSLIHSLT